jgi:exosortase
LTIAVVSLSDINSSWFGLLTVCWPLWCLAVVEVAYGAERRAQLRFSVLFLWFTLPFEPFLYELIDTPLQEMTADVAVSVLGLFGYETVYWNAHTFYSDTFYIIVDETCSGMNLLITLFMYALIFGWATRQTLTHRISLFLCVVPLAICSNGVRVAAIYLLGFYGGESVATGFWHDGSGVLAFLPTLVAIYGLGEWMRRRAANANSTKSRARLT